MFAALGNHLIEPFYARTIEKGATHSQLKIFYKQLYQSMERPVEADFFNLDSPQFEGVSVELFKDIKESYTNEVVGAIRTYGHEFHEHCTKLTNFILPELRTVLARQRRDYGISDEFEAQFPVEEQAPLPDDTPVNNLSMERNLGKTDYRLHKLKSLEAVSRSMILQRTESLREESSKSFRSYRKEAEMKADIALKWSKKMEEKFSRGMDAKRMEGEIKEGKRLRLLEELKRDGGPWTNGRQVRFNNKSYNYHTCFIYFAMVNVLYSIWFTSSIIP